MEERTNLYCTIFLLLFSIYIIIESYRLGLGALRMPGPGYFPFGAGIALGIVSLGLLTKILLKGDLKKILTLRNTSEEHLNWKNIILTLVSMFVYVIIFNGVGFVLSTFLTMVFLIWAVGKARWQISLITALSITLASYLLFDVALEADLPKGLLEVLF